MRKVSNKPNYSNLSNSPILCLIKLYHSERSTCLQYQCVMIKVCSPTTRTVRLKQKSIYCKKNYKTYYYHILYSAHLKQFLCCQRQHRHRHSSICRPFSWRHKLFIGRQEHKKEERKKATRAIACKWQTCKYDFEILQCGFQRPTKFQSKSARNLDLVINQGIYWVSTKSKLRPTLQCSQTQLSFSLALHNRMMQVIRTTK